MPDSRSRWYNRLALKLAVVAVGGILGMALLLSGSAWALAWQAALLLAVVMGVVVYGSALRLLAHRLDLARTTLRQIRKHEFDGLRTTRLTRGDELDGLIGEVYRTGLTLEKEIHEFKRIENYRREFLGNVSHELKTPIFSIQGYAETLLEGGLEDETYRRGFVEKILRNAGRLGNLSNDLTEISRIETGELKMTVDAFALPLLMQEVAEALEPLAAAKEITLKSRVADDVKPVWGDRERIRQVLINLVENAIKYNSKGGRVELVARLLASGDVKLSVVDNGIGIAPEHLPRLTERFYRVDRSRSRQQGGTGLGLAIVKHILGAHKRELVVESSPGRGSTFGFTLPTASSTLPQQRSAQVAS